MFGFGGVIGIDLGLRYIGLEIRMFGGGWRCIIGGDSCVGCVVFVGF